MSDGRGRVTATQPSALRNNLLFNVPVNLDDAIAESRRRWPLACAAFDDLLDRAPSFVTVMAGLEAESLVYSSLQAGPEFQAWRAATPIKPRKPNDEPAVLIERAGDELRVTLNRPERRNALGVEVRDGLLDAF
jgi:hypothetical protein